MLIKCLAKLVIYNSQFSNEKNPAQNAGNLQTDKIFIDFFSHFLVNKSFCFFVFHFCFRRLYCSNCLTKNKERILCKRCVIFTTRPISKIELLKLKAKDLIFYLQSKHISTTGCVGELKICPESVGLKIENKLNVFYSLNAYRKRGARKFGAHSCG